MKIFIIVLSIVGIILISNNSSVLTEVYAGVQAPDVTLPERGTIPNNSGVYQGANFIDAVELIINWLLSFIGIIVFVIFLFAGFEYATAGDNQDKAKSAQSRMVNAVIGLIIIFFAFVASNAVLGFVFQDSALDTKKEEVGINNIINISNHNNEHKLI
jgi:heme/copper-type cytochrome/quinol oxidase subunit 2